MGNVIRERMDEVTRIVNSTTQTQMRMSLARVVAAVWAIAIGVVVGDCAEATGHSMRQGIDQPDSTWSQWRGSVRDGQSHQDVPLIQELPEKGIAPVWISEEKIPSGNQGGWSSPIVDELHVYLYVHTKKRTTEGLRYVEAYYAWHRKTGELAWSRENETAAVRFPISGTPLVRENRLYHLAGERRVVCLDVNDGELIWETKLPGEVTDTPFHSSIASAQDKVVVHLDRLYACDASTGDLQWTQGEANSGEGHSSPVVWAHEDRELVIYIDSKGRANGVNPEDGSLAWQVEAQAGSATPLCAEDVLITYGRSRRGGVAAYRISENDATELWRNQEFADSGSSPVVIDKAIFLEGERDLACLDLETGSTQWTSRLDMPRPRYTSLIAAGDTLFYAFDGLLAFAPEKDRFELRFDGKFSRDGHLGTAAHFRNQLGIDDLEQTPDGSREAESIWRREIEECGPVPCCTPVIDDGVLFIRLRDRIAAYDLHRPGGETEAPLADGR